MKIIISLIFVLSLSFIKVSGEIIKNYGYLKDIKINKDLLIDRKINDFINLTMLDCKGNKLRYKTLDSGIYQPINNKYKKQVCKSLKEEKIKLECYPARIDMFISQSNIKRPLGLPYYYPVISRENINKENKFMRKMNCFINDILKEKDHPMFLMLNYKLLISGEKIGKMKLKEKEYNIIISNTELVPEIDDFKIERKRIVIID
tara:strand:- start:73 stop:684 length:612 start_codon:yes stop_codon:yes gene_type:complete